jgi:drug/metabolite transporter (DMT)-like permease
MSRDRRAIVAEASLVGIAAVWGLTFVMVQDAIALLPVFAFLAYRFLTASVLVAVVFRKQLRALTAGGLKWGLFMGIFLTSGYIFQTLGLERTRASNAGFITGMFVVLTPIFGAILLRQRAGVVAWLAALVATVGLALLSIGQGGGGEGSFSGDALVFGAACSFAFHILVTDRAVREHDAGALLAVQLTVVGVICLVVATIKGELQVPDSTVVWSALIVTAFVASALGFFVQTYAQQHASPSRTALILASEPAFAGFFAFVLAGERLNATGWFGALLIIGAIGAVEAVPYLRPVGPLPEGMVGEVPPST